MNYAVAYTKVVRYAASKHGTPQWNPPPHPDNDAAATVAARDSDPLWQYHRGLVSYGGHPIRDYHERMMEGKPNTHQVVLSSQIKVDLPPAEGSYIANRYGLVPPDHTAAVPVGMATEDEVGDRWRSRDADVSLTTRRGRDDNGGFGGVYSPMHPNNRERYESLFGTGARGRRPWFDAVFPLQDLANCAAPHDPYRLLAGSVISGNRHALPALVDLLRRRDNPAGWSPVWSALAKVMDDRHGDLRPADVHRRVAAIAEHAAKHSADPETHRQLAAAAMPNTVGWRVETTAENPFVGQRSIRVYRPDGEWAGDHHGYSGTDGDAVAEAAARHTDHTGWLALADHMEENGLPQYGQLVRLELANLEGGLRSKPRKKGSRL